MPGLAVRDFSHGYQNCLQANKTIIITRTNRIPFETKGCQETDLQRGDQVSVHSSPTRWKTGIQEPVNDLLSLSSFSGRASNRVCPFMQPSLPEAVHTRPRGYWSSCLHRIHVLCIVCEAFLNVRRRLKENCHQEPQSETPLPKISLQIRCCHAPVFIPSVREKQRCQGPSDVLGTFPVGRLRSELVRLWPIAKHQKVYTLSLLANSWIIWKDFHRCTWVVVSLFLLCAPQAWHSALEFV